MLPGSVQANNDLLLDEDFDWNFRFALWRPASGSPDRPKLVHGGLNLI